MKKFEMPELDVQIISVEDVITTSGNGGATDTEGGEGGRD